MKQRVLSIFMCAVLVFSAVMIAPGAGADGTSYTYIIENASAAKLAEFFGSEIEWVEALAASRFTDVPSGKWYTPAVKWASENDIVNGMTENTFDPQGNIQRQQMCVMLARFAKVYGIELVGSAEKAAFSDDNLIQNYAKDAVYACQQAGIISGMTPDTFAPRDNATRAQIAKIMTVFHRDFMTEK